MPFTFVYQKRFIIGPVPGLQFCALLSLSWLVLWWGGNVFKHFLSGQLGLLVICCVRGVRATVLLVIIKVTAMFIVLLVIVCLNGLLVALIGGCTPRRITPTGRRAPENPTPVPKGVLTTVATTIGIIARNGKGIAGMRGLWLVGCVVVVRERRGEDGI